MTLKQLSNHFGAWGTPDGTLRMKIRVDGQWKYAQKHTAGGKAFHGARPVTDTLNTTQEITGISLHTPTWNTTTGRGTIEVCHQKPLPTAALPGWIIEHDEVISHNGRSDLEHGDTVHLKVDCADPSRACHSVDGYYLNQRLASRTTYSPTVRIHLTRKRHTTPCTSRKKKDRAGRLKRRITFGI